MASTGSYGAQSLNPYGAGVSLDAQYNIGSDPAMLEALQGVLAQSQAPGVYADGTPWDDRVKAAYEAAMASLSALNVPGGGERTPENQAAANQIAADMQWIGARGWGGGVQQADQPTGFAPNGRGLQFYGANVQPFTDVEVNANGLAYSQQQAVDAGTQQRVGWGQTAPAGSAAQQTASAPSLLERVQASPGNAAANTVVQASKAYKDYIASNTSSSPEEYRIRQQAAEGRGGAALTSFYKAIAAGKTF